MPLWQPCRATKKSRRNRTDRDELRSRNGRTYGDVSPDAAGRRDHGACGRTPARGHACRRS
uniref:Uncharacterized protein n=1 Tax=uncultured alpha proteobacterium HF0130_06E21 TaxID=710808 RepID=E0XT40_9PROT|nr:hypothetical protein [uncultured alpha proteobacterium HF0130_06E21]